MIMWLIASAIAAFWIEHPHVTETALFFVLHARAVEIALIGTIVLVWAWRTR